MFLEILKGLFSGKSSIKKLFISTLDSLLLDQPEFSLSGIMISELNVPLPIEDEPLPVSLFISFNFGGPLLFEHFLLLGSALQLNL